MAPGFWSRAVSNAERIVKGDLNQDTSSHFVNRVWNLQIICRWCCCKNNIVVMIGGVRSRLVIGQTFWKCRAGGWLLPNCSNQCAGIHIQPKPRPAAPGEGTICSFPAHLGSWACPTAGHCSLPQLTSREEGLCKFLHTVAFWFSLEAS